jgi:multisubunit Na+/H+ antiporter MnhG subunit
MLEKLKEWFEDHHMADKLTLAATITILAAIIYWFAWALNFVFTWSLEATGLVWLLRIWVLGSFIYVSYMIYNEWKAYAKRVEEEEDEEDEPKFL